MTYELIKNGPLQQHFIQIHETDFVMAVKSIAHTPTYQRLVLSQRVSDQLALLAMVAHAIELSAAGEATGGPARPSRN